MSHKSSLETMSYQNSTMPMYINRAAMTSDPIERMKLFIASQIAACVYNRTFEKPLNPILGETFEGIGQDGSKIY